MSYFDAACPAGTGTGGNGGSGFGLDGANGGTDNNRCVILYYI